MTESELDSLYADLCRVLTQVGEARAPLLLARFALLAMNEINQPERVRALIAEAQAAGKADSRFE